MDLNDQTEDMKPVESVKKLSGQLAISRVGAVLPENMAQVTELAQYMAKAGAMLPAHLRANPAMCMGVIMDAIAWRMNPFRLATQHMVVNGVGSYMSQAITGIINQNAVIEGRLAPEYSGEGDKRRCTLKPVMRGTGQMLVYESPLIGAITPKNSPLWKTDPDQQLFYYSSRAWCRRYFPELLMGVYDAEEANSMRDITPKAAENFLHDDPAPSALDYVKSPEIATGDTIVMADKAYEVANADTGELQTVEPEHASDELITPAMVAGNIIKAIKACQSMKALNEVQRDYARDIVELPSDDKKRIRKTLADQSVEVEM